MKALAAVAALGALLGCTRACGAAEPAEPGGAAYRSVVIFGDTQSLVDGHSRPGEPLRIARPEHAAEYADLEAMVDWVVAHRERERIDFVLHVGDIIQSGMHLPIKPACRGPDGCIAPEGACNDASGRCLVPRPAGCTLRRGPRGGRCEKCPCWAVRAVEAEWQRFAAAWSRLDRAGIPYAIVRGNHDNVGDPGDAFEGGGYVQHFGRDRFAGLGPGAGLLETCPACPGPRAKRCCAAPDAHAWRLRLGSQDVLVIGPSWSPAAPQRDWVASVLDRHPDLPAIVVTHSFVGRNQEALAELVKSRSRQVFMRVEGHFVADSKRVESMNGHDVLVVRFDRQHTNPPLRAALAVIRFHPGDDGFESVEALTLSPTGKLAPGVAPRLARRPFRIPRKP